MGELRPPRVCALLASTALVATLVLATTVPATAAKPRCGGQDATIVGTNKGETIRGTSGDDVIVGRGGNDIIRGRGGRDIICGDGGNDRIYGQAGKDKLFGGTGDDHLYGGGGADLLAGQAGNDRLDGGMGTDTCYQGGGSGLLLSCELPSAAPTPTPGRILAIAYTNLDLVPGFDPTHDVLIAKLVDTDGNGPGAGDQVVMGHYPTKLDPGSTDFARWRVTLHTVTSVQVFDKGMRATTAAGVHDWFAGSYGGGYETYSERGVPATADNQCLVQDNYTDNPDWGTDSIFCYPESPSRPGSTTNANAHEPGDDFHVDVDLFP